MMSRAAAFHSAAELAARQAAEDKRRRGAEANRKQGALAALSRWCGNGHARLLRQA